MCTVELGKINCCKGCNVSCYKGMQYKYWIMKTPLSETSLFMAQAGSGDEFLELGHKWCMSIVHDVTSQYDI